MKKQLALLVAAVLLLAGTGCEKKQSAGEGTEALTKEQLLSSQPDAVKMPLSNPPEKMTMLSTVSVTSMGQTLGLGDVEAFREMEKRTGVQMEYQTVSAEKLSLLFASNEIPDMIYTDWDTLGGTYKYATDGQLIALDKLVAENAPDFLNVLKKDNSVYENLIDVDKHIYYFPFIRSNEKLRVFEGFQVRKDWLEKLNLSVPKSIDDMHTVLKAFKENDPNGNGKADELPWISDKKLSGVDRALNWWGIDSFYREKDTVKCGWLQPQYKDYLKTMAQWYKEGLIDPDYLTCDSTQFRSKAVTEQAGFWYGRAAGVLGTLEAAMASVNPEFSIVGVPWLSKSGKTGYAMPSKYVENVLGRGIAITSNCKNPALAAKWCNYAYSEEGNLLFNFGIEGESYTMEDGIPTYTKLVTKNPNGLSMQEVLSRYATPGAYAFEQSIYYFDQFMTGSQKDAIDVWKKGKTSRTLKTLKYSGDELEVANNLKNEITTYVSEMQSKFIVGKEPIENYDNFVKKVKEMGIDKVLEVMQTSYNRSIGK